MTPSRRPRRWVLRMWFAEHVEVDRPHRCEFWGRYTPDGDAPNQRPLHVDDHTLRSSWMLDGEDTTGLTLPGHQMRGPRSSASAGTSTERTTKVSSRTPTAPGCGR